ncbi:excinuclease ABC subunit UvrC [Goodfellowiella coeruleoviolacea]|uniref:UvrABC system protein C n=1 Tax=Goodfellowiella coeruleoviolacea TaxID=334858 RepID=A0AAE3GN01_9PSEU|nr:excinuclease ABC subunit UvrC [Goodfellowiella coeruleoviolacea]MCP2170229.1 Excinuclease ABC subunit C [Goodfellowiella coeruleoviolacea]
MADPSTYRPAPGTIPDAPGVYKFRDAGGRVIYVGKAKSLRSRLSSYFADLATLHPRTRQMVTTAAGVEWTVVGTEVEALQLEYSWIKEFDPRFNVRYRDDKSYPVLAVTLNEEVPRISVTRGARRKGVRYFGPYSHAWAIRETVDLLLRVFPARTCKDSEFKQCAQRGRPCLLGDIGKCSAPCVGRVSPGEHREIVNSFCEFMAGRTDVMVRRLEREMTEAAEQLEFERAARLRDDLTALRRAMEKQAVVFGDGTDADVVAFAQDELEAAVQVFHVRGGRVRGQRGWVVEKVEDMDVPGLVDQFITQFYGEQVESSEAGSPGTPDAVGAEPAGPVPREVLVPELPTDVEALTDWLSGLRGARVHIRVPQRGDKRALMETVARNAAEAFVQHKLRRAGDLTARSAALEELQQALDLDTAPLRIECVDVSHVQGTDVVASLVVFEDGLPRKSEYRKFAVREGAQRGDVGSIAEVVRRRFARYRAETGLAATTPTDPASTDVMPGDQVSPGDPAPVDTAPVDTAPVDTAPTGEAVGGTPPGIDPETGRPRKFAYRPNLLVVDGGAPQAAAAAEVLADLGVTDIAVIGLAKRMEEVWVPGEPDPVILPRNSEAMYLMQRVRDESHNFAIRYHRQKRSKRMVASELDAVPGLGQARKTALLKHFGSVRRLREASVAEIAAVPGFGQRTAETVHAALAGGQPGAAPGEPAGNNGGHGVEQLTKGEQT